jgi:hypothetical protein
MFEAKLEWHLCQKTVCTHLISVARLAVYRTVIPVLRNDMLTKILEMISINLNIFPGVHGGAVG